jgi:hypothetical protein
MIYCTVLFVLPALPVLYTLRVRVCTVKKLLAAFMSRLDTEMSLAFFYSAYSYNSRLMTHGVSLLTAYFYHVNVM